MPLSKQPLVHVFPGDEAPRKPEPPPNRYIREGPPFPVLALAIPFGVGLIAFLLGG